FLAWRYIHRIRFLTVDASTFFTGHESFSPRPIRLYVASTLSPGTKTVLKVSSSFAQTARRQIPRFFSRPLTYVEFAISDAFGSDGRIQYFIPSGTTSSGRSQRLLLG